MSVEFDVAEFCFNLSISTTLRSAWNHTTTLRGDQRVLLRARVARRDVQYGLWSRVVCYVVTPYMLPRSVHILYNVRGQPKITGVRRTTWNNFSTEDPQIQGATLSVVIHLCPFKPVNPLKPNDPYSGHTAPLASKRCILYIYSTNIGTELFSLLYRAIDLDI